MGYGAARRRARRRKEEPTGELALAAMVDMMINILLFLLQLYGNSTVMVQSSPELSLPRSSSADPIRYAVNVVVSRVKVTVGPDTVSEFPKENRPPNEAELAAIGTALTAAREAQAARPPATPGAEPEPARVILQVDRRLPWEQLSPVIDAVGSAGFEDVRFVVAAEATDAPG